MKPNLTYKSIIGAATVSALFMTALPSFAADWETIITTSDYDVIVDLDAYNVLDGLPFITSNTRYKTTQPFHVRSVQFAYIQKHITMQFDCDAHTYKHLKTVYFNQQMQLVGRAKAQTNFYAVQPNTTVASLESLVCQVHKMVGGY